MLRSRWAERCSSTAFSFCLLRWFPLSLQRSYCHNIRLL